jgi:hypothetical protein
MKDDKDNIQLSVVEDHDGMLTIRGGKFGVVATDL